jgi:hypothetical protein
MVSYAKLGKISIARLHATGLAYTFSIGGLGDGKD